MATRKKVNLSHLSSEASKDIVFSDQVETDDATVDYDECYDTVDDTFDPKAVTRKVRKQVAPFFWIKDASGHKSVSVTLLFMSFVATSFAYIASIFHKIGDVEIRDFNIGAASTYLIPFTTLYFSRKWTDARHGLSQMRENAEAINEFKNQAKNNNR